MDGKSKQNTIIFLISKFRRVLNVVFFLLGESPASEFYMSTFRNTCLFQLHRCTTYEDGTECSETPAYKIQTPGFNPKKEYNAIILLIRLPIFTCLGMGLESVYLYLMPQNRPVFPTSRLLVSPNSMVKPCRCRRWDRAFCFGLLYVAF